MNYSELLSAYIETSGLSIGEIARRMEEEKGVKIDRSYISMLKNGKTKNPASEDVNKALAEVTGGDPEKLVVAAYLEKAPESIKKFLGGVEDKNSALISLIRSLVKELDFQKILDEVRTELIKENPELPVDVINAYFENLSSTPESIYRFIKIPNILSLLEEKLSNMQPNYRMDDFLKEISKKSTLQEEVVPYEPNKMLRLPVLGSIRAGIPIDRIEYNEGYTLVDPDLLRGKEGFALRVKGDSMSGDRILEGDIVIVIKQEEVQPHEIAVVAIDGDEATLKRVKVHGDVVMLTPSNPTYEPQLVPAKEVHIIGKVVEVKFWPK